MHTFRTPQDTLWTAVAAPSEGMASGGDPVRGEVPRCLTEAAWRADAEGEALGLVSSKTSNPLINAMALAQGKEAIIDPFMQRSSRCRRSILNTARMITHRLQHAHVRYQVAFITLTYADGDDWNPRHISAFLHCVRQYLKRRGWPMLGLWKAETQKRGAIHYHLLLWLPRGVNLPKPDKQGWWSWGMTNITRARNAYGYVAKYLKKEEQGNLPKGARLFGLLGLESIEKREVRWWNTPRWIREKWPVEHDPRRAKGGGWVSSMTGEIAAAAFKFSGFVWMEGRRCIRFLKSETIERGNQDLDKATNRIEEINLWENMARNLQYTANRVRWLSETERTVGAW